MAVSFQVIVITPSVSCLNAKNHKDCAIECCFRKLKLQVQKRTKVMLFNVIKPIEIINNSITEHMQWSKKMLSETKRYHGM